MLVVDSHSHAGAAWFEPIETLLHLMDQNGVGQAVLVQFMGQTDNTYIFDCRRRFPDRFACVVLIDPDSANAIDQLTQFAEEGAVGVRLRPTARSPGDDPLGIWRIAEKLGLSVSCGHASARVFSSDSFIQLVESFPNLRIVLEHMGSLNRPDANEGEAADRQRVFALARFPNLYLKLPGLGEFVRRVVPIDDRFPFVTPIPPYLEQAYASFGPNRLMWGSDFPPVARREGYGNALRFCREQFADKPKAHLEQMFGGVAARIFPIR